MSLIDVSLERTRKQTLYSQLAASFGVCLLVSLLTRLDWSLMTVSLAGCGISILSHWVALWQLHSRRTSPGAPFVAEAWRASITIGCFAVVFRTHTESRGTWGASAFILSYIAVQSVAWISVYRQTKVVAPSPRDQSH